LTIRGWTCGPLAGGRWSGTQGRFFTLADPLRSPAKLLQTLTFPVGTLADRFRLLRLVLRATGPILEDLFEQPETPALEFLQAEGFSKAMCPYGSNPCCPNPGFSLRPGKRPGVEPGERTCSQARSWHPPGGGPAVRPGSGPGPPQGWSSPR